MKTRLSKTSPRTKSDRLTITAVQPLNNGTPTESQLALINSYSPAGLPPLTADEVLVQSFVAADNLVNRGKGKWAIADLYSLSDLLVSLPFTLDHDWDEVAKVVGRCFAARVDQSREADQDCLDRAGNYELNKAIVQAEGHYTVIIDVYFQRDSDTIDGMRFGRLSEVSIGGFRLKELLCPVCEVNFEDDTCPHLIPSPWMEYADPATRKLCAPYYVRSGVYDLLECSFVTTPNCCNAAIVTDAGSGQEEEDE